MLCMQAQGLREHIKSLPESLDIQAVIVSPLTRTLETAIGAFGGDVWQDGDKVSPLMVSQDSVEVRQALHPSCKD